VRRQGSWKCKVPGGGGGQDEESKKSVIYAYKYSDMPSLMAAYVNMLSCMHTSSLQCMHVKCSG
jgi:hypothetical protein